MENTSSSSVFQQDLEVKSIIPSLKKYFLSKAIQLSLNDKHYFNLGNNTKVQVDLCDEKNNIFGEIYTCGDKLLSGQQRKISSDILKLLTVEKNLNKTAEKYLVLTYFEPSNLGDEIHEDKDYEIISKLLGTKSWKIRTIQSFDFKVLIYFLTENQKIGLDQVKKAQGDKFRNKS